MPLPCTSLTAHVARLLRSPGYQPPPSQGLLYQTRSGIIHLPCTLSIGATILPTCHVLHAHARGSGPSANQPKRVHARDGCDYPACWRWFYDRPPPTAEASTSCTLCFTLSRARFSASSALSSAKHTATPTILLSFLSSLFFVVMTGTTGVPGTSTTSMFSWKLSRGLPKSMTVLSWSLWSLLVSTKPMISCFVLPMRRTKFSFAYKKRLSRSLMHMNTPSCGCPIGAVEDTRGRSGLNGAHLRGRDRAGQEFVWT